MNTNVQEQIFNIILEDGAIIEHCKVFSSYGIARDTRDVHKAIVKENKIKVVNQYINRIVSAKDVYQYEAI